MAVIQTVRFRLNQGSDEGEFRAVNERFQREVVPTLPGLLRREATRTADGEWLLVLRYDNAENVGKAQRGDTSDVARALMGFIDMRTMSAGVSEMEGAIILSRTRHSGDPLRLVGAELGRFLSMETP